MPVVVQRVEAGLVQDLDTAPALVQVARHQPLPGMGTLMLTVRVGVVAKHLVPMGLAEKELDRAVVKHMVRVA